jgi:hypothetical protein
MNPFVTHSLSFASSFLFTRSSFVFSEHVEQAPIPVRRQSLGRDVIMLQQQRTLRQ